MILAHLFSITIAFILDKIFGDPPQWPHPVKWIGSFISHIEKRWNDGRFRKRNGIWMLVVVVCSSFAITVVLVWICYRVHFLFGVVIEGMIIATTISQKSLKEAANEVFIPLKNGDVKEARRKLSYIVGRDTHQLDEQEIVRGTVETVTENISDGVTAPMFWAFVGGAPLAIVYRAINTCDSMVGYRNEKFFDFGWASAKVDDFVNWIPSRLTSFLMLLSKKPEWISYKAAWKIVLRDAKKHPSPNSGWLESAFAAIYGVQLGGMNTYKGVISNRAKMGDPVNPLSIHHIRKATQILNTSTLLFLITLWIGGIILHVAYTWFKSTIFI